MRIAFARSKPIMAGVVAITAGVLLCFQNCARTPLERPIHVVTMNSSGHTDWCLDGALSGFTVETFYARNVNVVSWVGNFYPDSDADGLPDFLEDQMPGFSSTNPHSGSPKLLDRVCYNAGNQTGTCTSVPNICNGTPGALGLSECDLQVLRRDQLNQPGRGLDTDQDGAPDYFEVLAGTDSGVYDSNQDPDHDNVLNLEEISRGSNPFYSDAGLSATNLMDSRAEKLTGADANGCTGEAWRFTIKHVQYVPTLENAPNGTGVLQHHREGDNVVVAVIKLHPMAGFMINGTAPNAKFYYQTFTVNLSTHTLPLTVNSFQEVLP